MTELVIMISTYGYSTSSFIITVQSTTVSANVIAALRELLSMASLQPSMVTRYGVFIAQLNWLIDFDALLSTRLQRSLLAGCSILIVDVLMAFTVIYADGCPAEILPLMSSSLLDNAIYSWPETEIGETIFQLCPMPAEPSSSDNISRYCGGSYSSGAKWSDVDFSQCSVWVSILCRNVH